MLLHKISRFLLKLCSAQHLNVCNDIFGNRVTNMLYSFKNRPKLATWVIIYIACLKNVYRIYDITFNGNMSLKAFYTAANIFTKMIPLCGERSRPYLGSLR